MYDTFLIITSHISGGGNRIGSVCVSVGVGTGTGLHCAPPTCFVHCGAQGRPMSVRSRGYTRHFYRPRSRGDNTFGSIRVFVCVFICGFVI